MSKLEECQRVLARCERPVFVAAGDRHEAREFVAALGLGGDEWVYVMGMNEIMGVRKKCLFVISGYQVPLARRDAVSWWWEFEQLYDLQSVGLGKDWQAEFSAALVKGGGHE